MNVGTLLPPRPRYLDGIPDLEAAGFTDFWFPDFQLAGADPFVAIAVHAARTRAARFGVAVCNPVTRHAAVVANLAATLNALYPGRIGVGMGVGASPLKALGIPVATLEQLDRFVRDCRALLTGEGIPVGEAAKATFLSFSAPALNTVDPVPLRIAAGGPRALRLAGQVADEVILGTVDPALVSIEVAHVRAGAVEAGRPVGDVKVCVLGALFMAEERPSLERLKAHVGGYVPNMLFGNFRSIRGREDELAPDLVDAFRRAEKTLAETAALAKGSAQFERYMEAVPDRYDTLVDEAGIRAKAIYGTHDEVDERLAALAAAGVSTVVLFPDPQDDAALATFARRHLEV